MENQQNQQTTQPQYQQNIVVVGKQKSVGVAFLLAFLFGPLGLLYSSVAGGIILLILGVIIGIITLGFGLIFIWIASIIWAIVAANNANKNLVKNSGINFNPNIGNPQAQQPTTQADNVQDTQLIPSQTVSNVGESASKSVNGFSDWITTNKKGLLIGGGSIFGLAILLVAIKFLLSINFKTNDNNLQSNSNNYAQDSTVVKSKVIEADNDVIIDTYLGKIGNKDFKLFIEKVEGVNVEGYNVTGTNKRPLKGRIVNKWTEPTGLGGDYTIFKLILTEPGDDKWDGEFNIDLYISDQDRHGKGSWKSFNGKLEHEIIIKDRLNE